MGVSSAEVSVSFEAWHGIDEAEEAIAAAEEVARQAAAAEDAAYWAAHIATQAVME